MERSETTTFFIIFHQILLLSCLIRIKSWNYVKRVRALKRILKTKNMANFFENYWSEIASMLSMCMIFHKMTHMKSANSILFVSYHMVIFLLYMKYEMLPNSFPSNK